MDQQTHESESPNTLIFAVHGMGLHRPMAFTEALAGLFEKKAGGSYLQVDGRLHPIIDLNVGQKQVRFAEGYWSPLTAGEAKFFQVMKFYLRTGLRGIMRSSRGKFNVNGEEDRSFQVPHRLSLEYLGVLSFLLGILLLVTGVGYRVIEQFSGHFASESFSLSLILADTSLFIPTLLGFVVCGLILAMWPSRSGPAPGRSAVFWFFFLLTIVTFPAAGLAYLLLPMGEIRDWMQLLLSDMPHTGHWFGRGPISLSWPVLFTVLGVLVLTLLFLTAGASRKTTTGERPAKWESECRSGTWATSCLVPWGISLS